MNSYFPNINPAAHSIEHLQARRAVLARLGLSGDINQKRSIHRKAELAAIDTHLRGQGERPQQVRRVMRHASATDIACVQAHAVPALPIAAPTNGYSRAVRAVCVAYAPARHSVYA